MKWIILSSIILVVASLATANTATYIGENEKEGPSAIYTIGFGSDSPRVLEFDVKEVEGLLIEYPKNASFDPETASMIYQRSSGSLPVEEYYISVESINPDKEVYNIPVTVRAYYTESDDTQVVQEREYSLFYRSQLSEVYGFEGDLISPSEEAEEGLDNLEDFNEEESTHNISLENSLMQDNETKTEEPEENSDISYPLLIAIVLVFGFILKEALL